MKGLDGTDPSISALLSTVQGSTKSQLCMSNPGMEVQMLNTKGNEQARRLVEWVEFGKPTVLLH